MMLRQVFLVLASAVTLAASGAGAQAADEGAAPSGIEAEQAGRGAELAQIWCAECHAVEPGGDAPVRTEAPAFEVIASREGQTREAIGKFLINPHPPMPDLALSRDQMRNLASYILSLKDDAAAQ